MEEPLHATVSNKSKEFRENRFQTKGGFCYVLPDRIIITDGEDPSKVRRDIKGENTRRNRYLVISILSATCLGVAAIYVGRDYTSFNEYRLPAPVLLAIGSLGCLVAFISNFRRSYSPIIERDSIEFISDDTDNIQRFPTFFTRYRVHVCYLDEEGRKRNRKIILPSAPNDGKKEHSLALKIFRNEGLID